MATRSRDRGVRVTIRILMITKDVGVIIGKEGVVIKSLREKSGANISIPSDEGTVNRIASITGQQPEVVTALTLIAEKLEENLNASVSASTSAKVPVTLKLIVPTSQCGSIIGREGSKIREIRDTSACSIQVESDLLPFSSERCVVLNGSPGAISSCISMLSDVMIEFPARLDTVKYKPRPANQHGQAYGGHTRQLSFPHPKTSQLRYYAEMHSYTEDSISGFGSNYTELTGDHTSVFPNLPTKIVNADTQETMVSNDVVGSIIGKHGSRINEIRSISGARIEIEKGSADDSKKQRTITITGDPQQISLAQYLINTSLHLYSQPSTGKETKKAPPTDEDEKPSSSTTAPQPLMSLTPTPSNKPILVEKLLSSIIYPGIFGRPGIVGPYPGATPLQPSSSFKLTMEAARLAFLNRPHHYSNLHSNRSRQSRRGSLRKDFKPIRSDSDEKRSPSPVDSSPNGKEKRKAKREKFEPY